MIKHPISISTSRQKSISSGWASIVLRLYIASFMAVGCAPRPAPVSVESARHMETRVISGGQTDVMKAAISALQDLRYSIDVLDSDLGIIVASLSTEGEQTRITDEPDMIDSMPSGKKILIVAAIIAIVAGFIAIISGGSSDDDDDDRHYGRGPGIAFGGNDHDNGPTTYEYKLNINVQEIDSASTRIRVSATGRRLKGSVTKQAGAIEDPLFFDRFFRALDESLSLD